MVNFHCFMRQAGNLQNLTAADLIPSRKPAGLGYLLPRERLVEKKRRRRTKSESQKNIVIIQHYNIYARVPRHVFEKLHVAY